MTPPMTPGPGRATTRQSRGWGRGLAARQRPDAGLRSDWDAAMAWLQLRHRNHPAARSRRPDHRAYHIFRTIWTYGRVLPTLDDDAEPRFLGYSVGRWEGDTFIVQSSGFDDRSWLDTEGHPHSDEMRVEERYQRASFDTLKLDLHHRRPEDLYQALGQQRNDQACGRHRDWRGDSACRRRKKSIEGWSGRRLAASRDASRERYPSVIHQRSGYPHAPNDLLRVVRPFRRDARAWHLLRPGHDRRDRSGPVGRRAARRDRRSREPRADRECPHRP